MDDSESLTVVGKRGECLAFPSDHLTHVVGKGITECQHTRLISSVGRLFVTRGAVRRLAMPAGTSDSF